VFIMMKMLETQVGQLAGRPIGDKWEYPRQPQGPEMVKATQTCSGETGVWDAEPLHEGSCCIRQDQKTKPACEDQKYD
jgi:hypothetical protein